MPTLRYVGVGVNAGSVDVHHAVKGSDYVRGYDEAGNVVVAFEGVKNFSAISYEGVYMSPTACIDEPCNDVKLISGKFTTKAGKTVQVHYDPDVDNVNSGRGAAVFGGVRDDNGLECRANSNEAPSASVFGSENVNLASADGALVGGWGNNNSGARSLIMGEGNTNTSMNSIVSGLNNNNSSVESLIVGRGIHTNSEHIVACGLSHVVNHKYVAVFGNGHATTADGQLLAGTFSNANATTLFALGNGSSASSPSNAFEVTKGGKVTCAGDIVSGGTVNSTGLLKGGLETFKPFTTSIQAYTTCLKNRWQVAYINLAGAIYIVSPMFYGGSDSQHIALCTLVGYAYFMLLNGTYSTLSIWRQPVEGGLEEAVTATIRLCAIY